MGKGDEKDIKKYVLPARRRTITIEREEGGHYEFDFCRPNGKQRDEFMKKRGLLSAGKSKLDEADDAYLDFTKDSVRLAMTGGKLIGADGKNIETYDFTKGNEDLDRLDNTVRDILMAEAKDGIQLSAADEYFRASGRPVWKSPSRDAVIPAVQNPGLPPKSA